MGFEPIPAPLGSAPTFGKVNLATGAAGAAGTTPAMVGGTTTVATTAVTASSVIQATIHTVGGTVGILTVPTRTPGTSFVITSSSGTDTSTVDWVIFN